MNNTVILVGQREDGNNELSRWAYPPQYFKSFVKKAVISGGQIPSFLQVTNQDAEIWYDNNALYFSPSCDEKSVLLRLDAHLRKMNENRSTSLSLSKFAEMFFSFPGHQYVGGFQEFLGSSDFAPFLKGTDWAGWGIEQEDGSYNLKRSSAGIAILATLTGVPSIVVDDWFDARRVGANEKIDDVIDGVESWDGFQGFFDDSRAKLKGHTYGHFTRIAIILAWAKEQVSIKDFLGMSTKMNMANNPQKYIDSIREIKDAVNNAGFGHILLPDTEQVCIKAPYLS